MAISFLFLQNINCVQNVLFRLPIYIRNSEKISESTRSSHMFRQQCWSQYRLRKHTKKIIFYETPVYPVLIQLLTCNFAPYVICSILIVRRDIRSEHEANTERLITKSSSMRHVEGGWPKDVDFTEQSDVSRFRKKAEKDDDYKASVKLLGPLIARCMKQNNTIDIYEVCFCRRHSRLLICLISRCINIGLLSRRHRGSF